MLRKIRRFGDDEEANRQIQELESRVANMKAVINNLEKREGEMREVINQTISTIRTFDPEAGYRLQQEEKRYKNLPNFVRDTLKGLDSQIRQTGRLETQVQELASEKKELEATRKRDLNNLKVEKNREIEVIQGRNQRAHMELKTTKEREIDELRAAKDRESRNAKAEKEREISILNQKRKQDRINQILEHEEIVRALTRAHDEEKLLLQGELLAPIVGFTPLTDQECKQKIDDISRKVHTLAFGPSNYDSEKLGTAFDQVSYIQNTEKRNHKFVLESYIWSVLEDMVFSTPFKVFGEYGTTYSLIWEELFANTDTVATEFIWPQPSSDSETWRYITFQVLQSCIDAEKTQRIEDSSVNSTRQKLIDSYKSQSAAVMEKISSGFSRISLGCSAKEVQSLVDQSCSVALEFGVQRCRLELFSPKAEEIVKMSKDQYEDLNYANNEGIARGMVLLPVRSGLKRTGDGQGRTYDQISNLRPAGIYLRGGGA